MRRSEYRIWQPTCWRIQEDNNSVLLAAASGRVPMEITLVRERVCLLAKCSFCSGCVFFAFPREQLTNLLVVHSQLWLGERGRTSRGAHSNFNHKENSDSFLAIHSGSEPLGKKPECFFLFRGSFRCRLLVAGAWLSRWKGQTSKSQGSGDTDLWWQELSP